MPYYRKFQSFILFFSFISFFCAGGICAQTDMKKPKRILVVHSYHESQKNHVGMMQKGIDEVLHNSGFQIKHFYMDTKRDNSPEWMDISGKLALDIVLRWKPALVISLDDNAQKYFARFLTNKNIAPFVVFSGVNADPKKYGFPAKNVTGILERPNVQKSISLLQKIYPGKIKRMLFLSDKSATTDSFHAYVKTLDLPVEVVASKQPLTFDEWKQTINKYKDKIDAIGIYVCRTVKRGADPNEIVPEAELIDYINKTTNLPTVGFFDSAATAGVLCAVSVSMKEQGKQAAIIALDLLRGNRKIQDIKILSTKRGRIELNLKIAKEKGIIIPYKIIKRAKILVK